MADYPVPREKQRKGNFPYINKIHTDYVYKDTGWKLEKEFDSKWLKISKDGVITVKANENGYAWDGCTPKVSFLNILVVGVPDGHIDYRTMEPFTYRASLVHDALYQYLDTVPVTKKEIDLLFLKMLGDFKLRRVYHFFVKHLGGRGVVQKGI
ncbi:MAG: hypothetical protein R3240_08400 [Gammaproteobacteria bacterium]|nr:hypothetical protein [Gammaproteobacteria bacterium]